MQKPFSALSDRGQLRCLTSLARAALDTYQLTDVRMKPLTHIYNATFRISTRGGDEYVLRICHPRRNSVEVVQSEVSWLTALCREAELTVPEPMRNRVGGFVGVVSDEGVPQPRLCVLFRWVKGRFLNQSLTPSHLFRVGELTAYLHQHAMHWERPAGFIRRRVDKLNPLRQERDDHFDDAVAAQAVQAVAAVSTPHDGAVVAAVIQKVWATLQALGEGPEVFGLLHSDLHQWNYLFHDGRASTIDFDDCGFGHWLYDLAVTLNVLRGHPGFPALREALLAGYRRSRSLPVEQEECLGAFMALRSLQDLLWVIEERNQPAFRKEWQAEVVNGLAALQKFVRISTN